MLIVEKEEKILRKLKSNLNNKNDYNMKNFCLNEFMSLISIKNEEK